MAATGIYTVDTVEFTVAGLKIPVQTVRLDLEINTVPSYTVSSPPHTFSPSKLDIKQPSLLDTKNILKSLFKLADNKSKCNLKIKLNCTNAGDGKKFKPVELELKDWILQSVSMGTVNVTSGYLINFIVSHPAINMQKFGLFSNGYANEVDLYKAVKSGSDVITIADSTFKAISRSLNKVPQKSPKYTVVGLPRPATTEMLNTRAKQLTTEAINSAAPLKYLKFDTSASGKATYNKLPLKEVMTLLHKAGIKQEAVKYAIGTSFIPEDTATVWDTILRGSIVWGYTVIPKYYEQILPVCPTSPWLEPTLKIYSNQIHQLTFPAYDQNPVLGVKCSVPGMGTAITGTSQGTSKMLHENSIGTWCYIPEGVLSESTNFLSHGRLAPIQTPPWFESLHAASVSLRKIYIKGKSQGKEKPISGLEDSVMTALYACQTLYAAFMFQMLFKQAYSASFISPITIDSVDNVPVVPGVSMSLIDPFEKKVAFNGYIVGVSHMFDLPSSRAMSTFQVSYCRQPGGYEKVCEEGDRNPLYK